MSRKEVSMGFQMFIHCGIINKYQSILLRKVRLLVNADIQELKSSQNLIEGSADGNLVIVSGYSTNLVYKFGLIGGLNGVPELIKSEQHPK
jgi:hypothetical protein